MKKLLLGTAVAALAASPVYAQDYQVEIGASYMDGDRSDDDFDGFGLNAQAHLDRVDTSKGPLNEAAFTDKSSFINLDWMSLDYDAAGDEDTTALSGRFVTQKNLIIEAGYTDFEGDESSISIGVGTYINNYMDVVVTYEDFDEADASSLSVVSHGLNQLQGDTALAYDLGLAYLDLNDESGFGISAGADYYLNKALSFGAGVAFTDVDDFDTSTFDVRADYFVTPAVRIGLNYETLGQDTDGDTVALNGAVRF